MTTELFGAELGRMIRRRREERDMTREQVAAQLPIDASTVGQIERGEIHRPPDDVLRGFARALDMSFDALRKQAIADAKSAGVKPAEGQMRAYRDGHGNLCLLHELPSGEPPTELVLFEEGLNQTTHGELLFDEVSARTTKATFEDKGQDRLPFDYDHGMLGIVTTPDSGKAAGWFVPGTDGPLTANDIQWTPAAEEAIRNREFRFFSPAVRLVTGDTEDGPQRVHSLINVALTNLPATKNQKPMVASETMPGDTGATYEDTRDTMSTELLKLLGAETEAGAIGLVTQLGNQAQTLAEALGVELGDGHMLPQRFAPLVAAAKKLKATAATATGLAEEVRELTAKLADGEREQLIAQLNDAGKLPEALHGWARTQDVASLRAFGDAAPAHPKYQGSHEQAGADTVVLTDAQKLAAKQLGYTDEEYAEAVLANEKAEADRLSGRAPSMRRAD